MFVNFTMLTVIFMPINLTILLYRLSKIHHVAVAVVPNVIRTKMYNANIFKIGHRTVFQLSPSIPSYMLGQIDETTKFSI